VADSRLEDADAAIREFSEDQGRLPTAASWTEAEMRPSEKTIRRQFGSFQRLSGAVRSRGRGGSQPVPGRNGSEGRYRFLLPFDPIARGHAGPLGLGGGSRVWCVSTRLENADFGRGLVSEVGRHRPCVTRGPRVRSGCSAYRFRSQRRACSRQRFPPAPAESRPHTDP